MICMHYAGDDLETHMRLTHFDSSDWRDVPITPLQILYLFMRLPLSLGMSPREEVGRDLKMTGYYKKVPRGNSFYEANPLCIECEWG